MSLGELEDGQSASVSCWPGKRSEVPCGSKPDASETVAGAREEVNSTDSGMNMEGGDIAFEVSFMRS